MRLSPVWNIKCFRGCSQLCELILLERAIRYSVLERIQLGGEMKLKLRPVIKLLQTLQGTSIWMRNVSLLCKVFTFRPGRTIYSSMRCFLKYMPTEHWKQFRVTTLMALTIKNWEICNQHSGNRTEVRQTSCRGVRWMARTVPFYSGIHSQKQLDQIMALLSVFEVNVWWIFLHIHHEGLCSCPQ